MRRRKARAENGVSRKGEFQEKKSKIRKKRKFRFRKIKTFSILQRFFLLTFKLIQFLGGVFSA